MMQRRTPSATATPTAASLDLLFNQRQWPGEPVNKGLSEVQLEGDTMLQSYPDYPLLDLYSAPSNDYPVDAQSPTWYQYAQGGVQTNGTAFPERSSDKLSVDWSTAYSSEQGNFIRASPQSSPFSSLQNHQDVIPSSMLLNGNGPHSDHADSCLAADHKTSGDQNLCSSNMDILKQSEKHVKDLLISAQTGSECSPMQNGRPEEPSTKLPGFHQAFGSTEIGRFSQPDGFFEAAVAAEQERKVSLSPPPPPPPKRGRAPRGGRKAKARVDQERQWSEPSGYAAGPGAVPAKKEWPEWNGGTPPCDTMSSLQRMNCYPYHEEQPRGIGCHADFQPQWHPSEPSYYERQSCNQYYSPYYTPPPLPPHPHDCYPPYHPSGPPGHPSWRGHPYYHPTHFPHHQPAYGHGHHYSQQSHYSEYRHYGYQSGRWAVSREAKYSSGLV